MIADAMEKKVLKPVNLSGTYWLPYIHTAVKVLLKSYQVIVAHFEDVTSTDRRLAPSAEVRGRAKNILKCLLEYKDVLFVTFVHDALGHLSTLSYKFQLDSLAVGEAVEALEVCCLDLVSLQENPGEKQVEACAQTRGVLHSGGTPSQHCLRNIEP